MRNCLGLWKTRRPSKKHFHETVDHCARALGTPTRCIGHPRLEWRSPKTPLGINSDGLARASRAVTKFFNVPDSQIQTESKTMTNKVLEERNQRERDAKLFRSLDSRT